MTLPKTNLELALWLESDRMFQLNLDEKSLEVQRQVVIEEFKQRYLNQPYGNNLAQLRALTYKDHAYKWSTIGKEISHIEKVTLDNAMAFYKQFYAPNNCILSICGDATGHGVASGMMVSVTKASLISITETNINLILKKLNQVIRKIDLGTLRMSLNIVEVKDDKIRMTSAAMPPIFLYKAATKKVEEIMQTNLPLGGLGNEDFDLIERDFESGDVVIQLSDGLPEAPNPAGEMYDYDRVKDHLEAVGSKSADEIKNSFIINSLIPPYDKPTPFFT